ncbi:PIN domain-containing protein [Rhizobium hainanense]|uniref:PIN domain-containing protein n=1 Tax=Rhizobium hainanense TaxID=52131 RepID=A0A1C3WKV3_9HYPH|nr:PIN domain-containing protein [Rhizobium hainanense]SCB40621.1 PIN domain-containing protein [Rhizobium hainanense]
MSTHRIFIDANIFIEMKDLGTLEWQAIFPGLKELRIVVSMHVIKELDKLKNDRNERRRKRARAALQLIDGIPNADASVLREQPYIITLEIDFPLRHRWSEYHLLDENDPDDRLVAHLIEDGKAALISDDSGPRIKASRYGINSIQPPMSFRLPPEESADKKKVRELTQVINELEDKRPRMLLKLGCPCDPIILIRPILPPIPQDLQEEIVRRTLAANPKLKRPQTESDISSLTRRHSPIDWVTYDRNYASFTDRVKQHVATFHEKLNSAPMALDIPFEVINAGRVTLENADVSIRLEGAAHLHVDDGEEPDEDRDEARDWDVDFPRAPTAESPYGFADLRFRAISSLRVPRIRFPGAVSFEWDVVPDDSNPQRANLSNKGKREFLCAF